MRTDGETDRQTDRQTYMKKLTVAFRKFANATKDVTVQILRTLLLMGHIWFQKAFSAHSCPPEVTHFTLCPSIWL